MTVRSWLFAATLVAALPGLAGAPARAEPEPPPLRLVTGGGMLALVRGRALQLFTADGRPLGRLGPGDPADRLPVATAGDARERAFDLLGVPEASRDSQAAEDLLEDDATLAERRALARADPSAAERDTPALAAATADGLVAIAGGGLYHLRDGALAERVGPAPPGATALATTGESARLWVARGAELLTREAGVWRPIARERQPIDHLVGSSRGWLAWSTGSELILARVAEGLDRDPRGSARTFRPPSRIRALAACGAELLILADDGLHLAPDPARSFEPPIRIAGPLAGERLACGDGPDAPWLVTGPGLLASVDHGRGWQARADVPAETLADAAVATDRVWLLARSGALLALPLTETTSGPATVWSDAAATPRFPRSSPWLTLLPRLVLTASHTQQGPRREQRLLAFAEFPLQPPPPAPPVPLPPPVGIAPPPGPPFGPDIRCLPLVRSRAVDRALADPARARSLVTRAGRSAWLPELRLRMERRLGRNESVDVKPATSGDALGLDTVDDVRYEVRATWDLPRLVFNPEEVAAYHQALRTAEMRRDIESLVNRLFFERRRLLLPPATSLSPTEHGERLVRLDELAAELDAVSGGAFSRCGAGGEPGIGP
jgi:hypothetical protein